MKATLAFNELKILITVVSRQNASKVDGITLRGGARDQKGLGT